MIASLCLGAAVSFVVTGLAIPLLAKVELWDVPNARSSHTSMVPRGGGVGVLLGFVIGFMTMLSDLDGLALVILASVAVMGCTGFADDVRGMEPLPRLGLQLLTALALAVATTRSGDTSAPALVVIAVGTVFVAAYINAFNFMDGINGISGMSAVVAGLWYAWVGNRADSELLVALGLALAGAAIGFIPWNVPHARVFLGDVGSYGIGAIVSALALCTWVTTSRLDFVLAPLTVYLADTSWTLIRRARRHVSLLDAHREHAYQRLALQIGHVPVALLVASGAAAVCVVSGAWSLVPALIVAALVSALYLLSADLFARKAA